MHHPRCSVRLGLLAGAVFLSAAAARADLVRLKNGGEVRGQLAAGFRSGDELVTIETLSGGTVVVAREQAEFVTRRSLTVEHYESRARQAADTVAAQWELAEWCRENGLKSQREIHLRRVVELDPTHQKAHYGLGHSFRDGKWIDPDAEMEERGYVRYKGRWITPQELALIERNEDELAAEREWFRKVKLWHNWIASGHPDRTRQGMMELQQLTDPHAATALSRYFADEPSKPLRALYVATLSHMEGDQTTTALVRQSLFDVDDEIRYAALNGIPRAQYDAAMALYVRELRNELNPIVLRAGAALQRVGNDRAVPALIDALVTTHHYRVTVPDTSGSVSFNTAGGFGNSGTSLPANVEMALRTGQIPGVVVTDPLRNLTQKTKVVTVERLHQNPTVLIALQQITSQDYGYDERVWRLWHNAHKAGADKENP